MHANAGLTCRGVRRYLARLNALQGDVDTLNMAFNKVSLDPAEIQHPSVLRLVGGGLPMLLPDGLAIDAQDCPPPMQQYYAKRLLLAWSETGTFLFEDEDTGVSRCASWTRWCPVCCDCWDVL